MTLPCPCVGTCITLPNWGGFRCFEPCWTSPSLSGGREASRRDQNDSRTRAIDAVGRLPPSDNCSASIDVCSARCCLMYPASAFELRICRCEARAASSCLTVPRTQSLHGRICLGHLCIECTRNSAAPVAIRAMQLRFGAVSGSIAMCVFSRLRVRVRHVQRYIV